MMIPPQEVKGKTINGLQQEINDAKKQIEENKNKKQLTQEQIQTVNAEKDIESLHESILKQNLIVLENLDKLIAENNKKPQ